MPDTMASAFGEALAIEGVFWLVLAAAVAGFVRGLAGFGTALIFLPVAGIFLPPIWAMTALIVMDVIGPLPQVPRAIREGHPRDVLRMVGGVLLAFPIGLSVLLALDPIYFRWAMSFVTLAMLAALMTGWRYRGTVTRAKVWLIGMTSGFLGGVSGLPGPPVILFYMARPLPPAVIRSVMMLFLLLYDFIAVAVFAAKGLLVGPAVAFGAVLMVPNLIGISLGAAMFRPDQENRYRVLAYVIIGAAAGMGLPLWGA